MKDPRKRFTAVADAYDRYRPSYPASLFDWLQGLAGLTGGARVADIGCGTGISTRLFAARGWTTVGVDPNEAMLARARAHAGGAEYRRGEAAATGLPDGAFDLVAAAQAFHWFPVAETLAEWRRIGKAAAWGAAFWNLRDSSTETMREYEAILTRFCTEYQERPRARQDTIPALRERVALREAEFPNVDLLSLPEFLGRAASASYVAHGVADRAGLEAALRALFDTRAERGRLAFRYRTVAAAWRLRG
ncbi:MAG: class I SAM-dependent methyltransferase [Elusimicrobia bacterium]|nr:class I SAM-dependent methyltransferase [Elusimicrobiota bacterium]